MPFICQVLSKSILFQRDIYKNVFQSDENNGIKLIGFPLTMMLAGGFWKY